MILLFYLSLHSLVQTLFYNTHHTRIHIHMTNLYTIVQANVTERHLTLHIYKERLTLIFT